MMKVIAKKYVEAMITALTAAKRTSDKVFSRKFLFSRLPILTWIGGYTLDMLLCDTIAGVTTALTVIPQGIGHAPLAGLPLQYGLYCSVVPGFVYCLLGTVRYENEADMRVCTHYSSIHVGKYPLSLLQSIP